MIRRLLTFVIGLVVILVLTAIIVPFLIPESVYREQAQIAASENLGREVILGGNVSLRLLPSVQVQARNVSIANEDGFGDTPFAEMAEMRVGVQLLPLLSRNVVIDEFVLVDPAIRLEQRGSRNNWSLGSNADDTASTAASEGFVRRPGALPFDASLGDIRIENGSVTYLNGNDRREINGLDLEIRMPGLDQPLDISGELTADGESMTLAVHVGSVRGFFEGEAVAARLDLGGNLIDLGFNGNILEGEELRYSGRFSTDIPSIRALADFAGSPLPPGESLENFELSGILSGGLDSISLDASDSDRNDHIRLDDLAGTGRLGVSLSGVRPSLDGALSLERLDVTPYMPVAPEAATGSAGVPAWSTDPIDLSALSLLDASFDLNVGELILQDIEISDAALTVEIVNSRLEANLTRISLYEGAGSAIFVANARTATPSFRVFADLESISALPLLEAAAGFDRLSGTGRLNIDLLTSGDSQADLMNALRGTGGFAFTDGAIRGVNLAQAIRGIESALTSRSLPDGFGEQEETDFSALEGTFTVANGIATNNDLIMLSPLVRVDGAGTIGIGQQTIDYRLRPRAVASIQGQGGERDLQGVVVPIVISGTFNEPRVGIDWDVVGRALVQGTVSSIIAGEDPEDAIRNALGNALGLGGSGSGSDEETPDGSADEEDADPAERLLQGLFGNQRTGQQENEEDGGNE
jgi:AsmA protein